MYAPVYTKQFAKDANRCQRRGKDLEKCKVIARTLLAGESLAPAHRDHRLVGNFAGRRECHIAPDWLLIYRTDGQRMVFERMGTHSDLFQT